MFCNAKPTEEALVSKQVKKKKKYSGTYLETYSSTSSWLDEYRLLKLVTQIFFTQTTQRVAFEPFRRFIWSVVLQMLFYYCKSTIQLWSNQMLKVAR